MKDQVAASTVAFASIAHEGVSLAGDLVLVVVADEEVGAGYGLSWLVEEHPDAARCDYAINEGGGDRLLSAPPRSTFARRRRRCRRRSRCVCTDEAAMRPCRVSPTTRS